MGVHYSERKYYDDPIENERFIRYYGATLYCRHGQPSTAICYRCKEEQANIQMRKYWDRLNIKYRNFNWNSFFGMESPVADNSTDENEDFKIMGLKKSSSREDLKKAYKKMSLKTHPDKIGGDGSTFKRMRQAFDNIMNKF
tara:strand:- start:452 stop:874 length:423 start_codon:yes stop_codon:yes gene_type:complete